MDYLNNTSPFRATKSHPYPVWTFYLSLTVYAPITIISFYVTGNVLYNYPWGKSINRSHVFFVLHMTTFDVTFCAVTMPVFLMVNLRFLDFTIGSTSCVILIAVNYIIIDGTNCILLLYVLNGFRVVYLNVTVEQGDWSEVSMKTTLFGILAAVTFIDLVLIDNNELLGDYCPIGLPASFYGHEYFIIICLGLTWFILALTSYPLVKSGQCPTYFPRNGYFYPKNKVSVVRADLTSDERLNQHLKSFIEKVKYAPSINNLRKFPSIIPKSKPRLEGLPETEEGTPRSSYNMEERRHEFLQRSNGSKDLTSSWESLKSPTSGTGFCALSPGIRLMLSDSFISPQLSNGKISVLELYLRSPTGRHIADGLPEELRKTPLELLTVSQDSLESDSQKLDALEVVIETGETNRGNVKTDDDDKLTVAEPESVVCLDATESAASLCPSLTDTDELRSKVQHLRNFLKQRGDIKMPLKGLDKLNFRSGMGPQQRTRQSILNVSELTNFNLKIHAGRVSFRMRHLKQESKTGSTTNLLPVTSHEAASSVKSSNVDVRSHDLSHSTDVIILTRQARLMFKEHLAVVVCATVTWLPILVYVSLVRPLDKIYPDTLKNPLHAFLHVLSCLRPCLVGAIHLLGKVWYLSPTV